MNSSFIGLRYVDNEARRNVKITILVFLNDLTYSCYIFAFNYAW